MTAHPSGDALLRKVGPVCEIGEARESRHGTSSAASRFGLVSVRRLGVDFGAVRAIDHLDLDATAGQSVALIGANGAGKSTTLRVLAGVLPVTSGSVHVANVDVVRDADAVRAFVGYCPDVGGLIPRATPWEHLSLSARLRRMPDGWQADAAHLLERFDLEAAADRVCAGFSHGMGRRMSVVLAVFHQPDVLLLDEPFDGVDPHGVQATMAEITAATERGCAVVVSTHLLPYAAQACDTAVVLRRGRAVATMRAAELAGSAGAERYRRLLS